MTPYFVRDRAPLRVQTVLFNSDPARVTRALVHLRRAVEIARDRDIISTVEIVLGDGSAARVFDADALEGLRACLGPSLTVRYEFFGKNLGTARGHNTLFERCEADFVLVMNPDVLLAPDCLVELFRPFRVEVTGIVEARQMPIEHPKDYSPLSGETSWASTACCLIPAPLWRELEGFDADSFFLYCDDVDFSWRVRLHGRKVIFQPSAVVFHDKRLSNSGTWQTTSAERYYSAEAALLLAHKYGRPDVLQAILKDFNKAKEPHFAKAVAAFKLRKKKGKLCPPIDPQHLVAEFVRGEYANHRFKL